MRKLLPFILLVLLVSSALTARARVCTTCCEDCYDYGWAAYDQAYAGYLETAIALHGGYPGPEDQCWDEIYNLAVQDAQAAYADCLGSFCWPSENCYPWID